MAMGAKALVLFVLGSLIPLAVPIIHFPSITALAICAGIAVAVATLLLKQRSYHTGSADIGNCLSASQSIPATGANLNPHTSANRCTDHVLLWQVTIAGMGISLVVLLLGHAAGAFSDLTFLDRHTLQPQRNLIFSFLSVVYIFLGARLLVFPMVTPEIAHIIRTSENRKEACRRNLDELSASLSELHAIQHDIDILCRDLAIQKHTNFFDEARTRVCACRTTTEGAEAALKAVTRFLEDATEERRELEQATACYETATAKLSELRHIVINTVPDATLCKEFRELSDALSSDELKSLLGEGTWQNFYEVISLLVADIEALERKARQFARGKRNGSARDDEEGTNIRWAYDTLKVKPTATSQEIKRAFRALCVKWHPDTGRVSDDSRIKEITRAYHVLKKTKQFT